MAAGLGPWLLALALGPAGVCAQWRLEASGGGLRAPGEAVHLSCRGYGFKLEGVWWYRQAPGGHLKWLSDISTSSYVRSSPEVEGRLKGSRDDSRSIISLSLHNLRPEDSASYFCAITREQEILQSFNKNPFLDTAMVAGYTGLEGAGAALRCSWTMRVHRCTPRMALSCLQDLLFPHHSFSPPESQKLCRNVAVMYSLFLHSKTSSTLPSCPQPTWIDHFLAFFFAWVLKNFCVLVRALPASTNSCRQIFPCISQQSHG
ncbi:hypothetical protein CIB84_016641 [Bambusicola thoracicus]|uniref:Ig-like domain-containing protein n=1 Tax=Bambusicola thoracicus TaxID=9083 RepID=A0A2P4S682_BAMTH|nr:hypothetical protein CIB84_016641 [Bambusicola thoracicus]